MQQSNVVESPKVLILDTSPSMAQVVSTYATLEGYEADVFSDSVQACAALARDSASGSEGTIYDCVILGWPKNQTGLISDFLQAIERADNRELPLIVLSEEAEAELRRLARSRAKTRLLFWRDYKRIDEVLQSLMHKSKASSRTASGSVSVSTTVSESANNAADLVERVVLPSILIDDYRNILATNSAAAMLLSDGNQQALLDVNFEKAIHGAPVKLSSEEPVKALFRTLAGGSLSVAYRSTDITATEYGLADEARLVTFEPVLKETPTTATLSVSEAAGISPILTSNQTGKLTPAVVQEVTPAAVEQELAASSVVQRTTQGSARPDPVHSMIDQALRNNNDSSTRCMLMLDIKIVASKTRDRLSLGKSQAMLAVVQDELARHYEDENSYKYIDNGQFVFLFESDTLQQTRLLAQELVVKVPELIAHLSDIELLSHASFLQLPGGSELSAGAILAHCTAACLKVEKDGMDNKIFEINSQKLTRVQKPTVPAAETAALV